jgi:hypothetical protein
LSAIYRAPFGVFEHAFLAVGPAGIDAQHFPLAWGGINAKRAVPHAEATIGLRELPQPIGYVYMTASGSVLGAQNRVLALIGGAILGHRQTRHEKAEHQQNIENSGCKHKLLLSVIPRLPSGLDANGKPREICHPRQEITGAATVIH